MQRTYEVTLLLRKGANYQAVTADTLLQPQEMITAANDHALFVCMKGASDSLNVLVPVATIRQGYLADRPTAGVVGRCWIDTTGKFYVDAGATWITVNADLIPYNGSNKTIFPIYVDGSGFGTGIRVWMDIQFGSYKINSADPQPSLAIIQVDCNRKISD
jgi:hypothetical protein